ncbi:hypothetical protein AB9F43_17635 [Rhizobium leguminosarum]|uniref:hypothetical protein n=1 Tax=Rhizobium leguminosarum TaxID=384 RepID=UPI0004A34056|nr:hypothetical protein [Rhizobium leguminosarum]
MTATLEILVRLLPILAAIAGAGISAWLSANLKQIKSKTQPGGTPRRHVEFSLGDRRIVMEFSGVSEEAISKIEREAKDAVQPGSSAEHR